jgi:type II secretory pathway pseudopilin PulG
MIAGYSHHRSEGFALVEALASLVILGMIGLMIVEGVGAGRRVWERLDLREAGGEALDSAQTAIRDRLEQIYPATLYEGGPPTIDFDGQSQSVVFLAAPPRSSRPSGLRRYTLSLNAKAQLTLSSISAVGPERAPPTIEVLLQNVRWFELAYFGGPGSATPHAWVPEWRSEATLPQVIRIRLALETDDQRRWPDLKVRPWATIDAGCLFNPVTHHCRGRS